MIYAELARQHQLCPPLKGYLLVKAHNLMKGYLLEKAHNLMKGYLLVTAQNLTTMSVLTELAPVQQSMTFTVSTNIEM